MIAHNNLDFYDLFCFSVIQKNVLIFCKFELAALVIPEHCVEHEICKYMMQRKRLGTIIYPFYFIWHKINYFHWVLLESDLIN